jgi:hypothetical protein
MYVCLLNPYGIDNGIKIWYRKQGDNCFDFVSSKEFASPLTKDDVLNIMRYADWYKQQYNASAIRIEG